MKKLLIGLIALGSISAFANGELYPRFSGNTLIIDYTYLSTVGLDGHGLPVIKKKKVWCEEINGETVAVAEISVKKVWNFQGYYIGTESKKFRFNLNRLCGGVSRIFVNGKEFSI